MVAATHLHSIPAREGSGPCEVIGRSAHPHLRPYVVGYGGFRSGCATAVPHRLLPLNLVTVIIELDGTTRLVTGPRTLPALFEQTVWGGNGVSVGLTPAGAAALLGTPMRDLVQADVPLGQLLGRRETELADRLDAAPGWPTRFAVLDKTLATWLGTGRFQPDEGTLHAWWQLQRSVKRPPISALAAELGVGRRTLELRFQRHLGLSPGSVARIARFQRAVGSLTRRTDLSRIAVDCGYADQSHFNREVRAMAGLTPVRLRAFLQYRELAAR